LPRPWQIVAAGGAISCGGRQKTGAVGIFVVEVQDVTIALPNAKIQKIERKCKFFALFF